jgi:hypothetical protein
MLPAENLSPRIQEELAKDYIVIAPVEQPLTAEPLLLTDRILRANRDSPSLQELREQASKESGVYLLKDGLLLANGCVIIPDQDDLRTLIIKEAHTQKATAHPGRKKTIRILRDRYYWKGITGFIEQYINNCYTCRRAHVPRDKTPGLLHLLPIPSRLWQYILMDFKSFPPSKSGYNSILVVIDRLGKRLISVPCHKTITARELAALFINYVWRYYGPPDIIVSDRRPQFISSFWKEFCNILGIKLKLLIAEQPQTDGQTEIIN